jgi:cysteine synthase B
MKYESVEELIGNTPLVKIPAAVHGLENITLYAKLEYYNPFGSVKDRVAYAMFNAVRGELREKGKTVLESSSGNTAKALAVLCSMNGLAFETVTNRIKYPEIRGVLQTLAAQIEELPGLSDCPDPFDPNDAIQYSRDKAAREPERFHLTDQYFNVENPRIHHETTGRELLEDLGEVHYFFGFLGTCGSTVGTGRALREKSAQTMVFGVVGDPGHKIPGGRNLDELWEVGFFQKEFYSSILSGTTHEAVDGMLMLNRRCGLLCGPTSGLVFTKALEKLRTLDKLSATPRTAVFIACDRMEPYLSFLRKHRPELFDPSTKRITVESVAHRGLEAASITPEKMTTELASRDLLIVDIRGYFAFSVGHIPGSMNIVDDLFAQLIETGDVLPKRRPVVVVCRIGDISAKYAIFLAQRGFEAYSLRGGFQAYRVSGLEVEKSIGTQRG